MQLFAVEKDRGEWKNRHADFFSCMYIHYFPEQFCSSYIYEGTKERHRTNPKILLTLHKWALHIPDAAEKASMKMYSPLSSALLWKVLLQVQSCISNFLHWKLPAYLKEMSLFCWALSPRIIQFDKFLMLLLSVDYNGSYFWGDGMEENCGLVTLSNTLLPCTLYYTSGNRVLSVHSAVLCVPARSAQQWPLQPRFFCLGIICLCHQLLLEHFIWWTGLGDNCSG